MKITLIDNTIDPLFIISWAARTCYNSRSKDTLENRKDFVKGLIKSGHETPLEFCYCVFDIKDISRACLSQLTRHRIGIGFCVESQRYTDSSKNDCIIPLSVQKLTEGAFCYVKKAKEFYKMLIDNDVPKEDARMFLPLGTTTNVAAYFNFRALRHFLKLRLDKHAQWEIRKLALEIYQICQKKWPWLIEDIKL